MHHFTECVYELCALLHIMVICCGVSTEMSFCEVETQGEIKVVFTLCAPIPSVLLFHLFSE